MEGTRAMPRFDAIIIGTGQAGPSLARRLVAAGRKVAIVARSRNGVERSLKSLEGCTVYQGHGRFISPSEVQVGETILSAPQIFINVGGRPSAPPMPGLDEVPYLTNVSMMD